jgi:hypothetical protein
MRKIHRLITGNWPVVLLGFTILSLAFMALNRSFEHEVKWDRCFQEISLEKRNPQAFTSAIQFIPLEKELWRDYVHCHEKNSRSRRLNTGVFLMDDIWALFFVGLIYLLANYRDFRFTVLKKNLLGLLLLAYGFDFAENAIYLSLTEVSLLPTIGTLKLIFYAAALILALSAGAMNYRKRKKSG